MRFSSRSKASKIFSLVSIVVILSILLMAGFALTRSGKAARASSLSSVPVIDDATLKAMTSTIGGASPLPTTRTVPHWFGQTVDPHNGVTYGYNMAGANPNNCSVTNCSVTIQADITPVIVNIDGLTLSGNEVLAPTLASPQFALNDYGSTPAATAAGAFPNAPALIRGPGGVPRKETRATRSSSKTRRCGHSSTRPVRATTT